MLGAPEFRAQVGKSRSLRNPKSPQGHFASASRLCQRNHLKWTCKCPCFLLALTTPRYTPRRATRHFHELYHPAVSHPVPQRLHRHSEARTRDQARTAQAIGNPDPDRTTRRTGGLERQCSWRGSRHHRTHSGFLPVCLALQLALKRRTHPVLPRPLARWSLQYRILRQQHPAAAGHRHYLPQRWQLPGDLARPCQEGTPDQEGTMNLCYLTISFFKKTTIHSKSRPAHLCAC